jgi:hypothetical protein
MRSGVSGLDRKAAENCLARRAVGSTHKRRDGNLTAERRWHAMLEREEFAQSKQRAGNEPTAIITRCRKAGQRLRRTIAAKDARHADVGDAIQVTG